MSGCTCVFLGARGTRVDPNCSAHGDRAQPLPVGNDLPVIHELVKADLQQRLGFGVAKYGQPLQPYNGRNALRDAYEEILDLAVYLRQQLWEQENPKGLFDSTEVRNQQGDVVVDLPIEVKPCYHPVTRIHGSQHECTVCGLLFTPDPIL